MHNRAKDMSYTPYSGERATNPFLHGSARWSKIDDLETSIEPFSETYARFPQLVKALSKLRTYIVNNRHLIPNYGERYRHGQAIATGFVESTVNEVVKAPGCSSWSAC